MPRLTPDWKGYDQTIIEFLTSQNKGTQNTYKSFFKLILQYTGMTGQQILESKKADKNFEWERKVLAFKQWIKTQKTKNGDYYSDNAANTATNTLRSFFEYYRTPLVFNQSENRKLNGKAHRVTQDYLLTNDDLAKMVLVADLREKYITLAGKSFGLRVGDFTSFTYGTFRSLNLNEEIPVFVGEVLTQKEGILAFPFIDSDALPIVKAVLDANRDKSDSERIIGVQDEELTTILQGLATKANIQLGGKRLRFHCLRKYLIDRLSANMSESKWKQIVGKSISEDAYVSSFELRECYSKTMRLTTIGINGNGKVAKLAEEVNHLSSKLEGREKIIDSLIENGNKKDVELETLKAKVAQIEGGKAALEALLQRVMELEKKLK